MPYKGHRIPSTRTLLLRACMGSLGDCGMSTEAVFDAICVVELGAAGLGAVGFPQRLQYRAALSSCMPQYWQYKAALPDRYNDRYDYIEYLSSWTYEES